MHNILIHYFSLYIHTATQVLIGSQNDEVFDSTASPIDLDEASKRCVLAEIFYLTHFKSFQSKIIDAALKRKDTLVIQPTGSGKSLCFQFPAVYTKKLTLVITPTIRLQQDQTHHLSETGISAIFLASAHMDAHADSKVFSPDSTVSLLFVSPKWLFNGNDRNLAKVQRLCASGKVCLVAIDEAHLIYDWQDFRQSYKKCEEVHTLFPGVPVMALSATVTPQVHTALTTILISGFYKKAFEFMFHTCQSYHSNFKVGESLKGIIIDWSDTEAKGLRELLGDNVADKVLKGCNVHWTRSYQRVADKVNNNVHRSNRVLAKEAFCAVTKQVMLAKTKEDVLKLFDVLQGKAEILTVQHLLSLPDEHLTVVTHNCDWSSARPGYRGG